MQLSISGLCTVPKEIEFPRYNTKCSWENEILCGLFREVSRFPLHFVLYLGLLFGQCLPAISAQNKASAPSGTSSVFMRTFKLLTVAMCSMPLLTFLQHLKTRISSYFFGLFLCIALSFEHQICIRISITTTPL